MITVRDILAGFQSLPIRGQAVIAHGSFKAFGKVQGGPRAVIDALIESVDSLLMPAFTYQTMVVPEVGPPNNAMDYGAGRANADAVPFTRDLPVDPEIGILAETLRRRTPEERTTHPTHSFTGVNARYALDRQTLFDPLAPIGALAERNGWVVLMGVDHFAGADGVNHCVNTSIHYAEKLAGRKQFIRWALAKPDQHPARIVECSNFPGDSAGFDVLAEELEAFTDSVTIGDARVEAIRLSHLFEVVQAKIKKDPLALLCGKLDCGRCNAVRASV